MSIISLIADLQHALDSIGHDADVVVDTEAGTFPCHCVAVESVNVEEIDGKTCIIYLDSKVMERVH